MKGPCLLLMESLFHSILPNIGMKFVVPTSATYGGNPQTMFFVVATSAGMTLVLTISVFANEYTSATPANAILLNLQTGYVIAYSDDGSGNRTLLLNSLMLPFQMILIRLAFSASLQTKSLQQRLYSLV